VERVAARLTYNSKAVPQYGTFKLAYQGVTQPVLQGFPSNSVAIKQCYDKHHHPSVHLLEGTQQIVDLTKEIQCSQWAAAFTALVYDFMAHSEYGTPPFPIPKIDFVLPALALEDLSLAPPTRNHESRQVFMLEPYLNGPWRKLINNASARPLAQAMTDDEGRLLCDFLVFCQHVQYLETKGCAYISDFQGESVGHTLSDPQIMTNPTLGDNIFGGGNVGEAFNRFPAEHQCSKFCKFYCLTFNIGSDNEEQDEEQDYGLRSRSSRSGSRPMSISQSKSDEVSAL
ncbi:hypothetical protein OH76DRAFT_1366283, partial [Lentinus brumalis]